MDSKNEIYSVSKWLVTTIGTLSSTVSGAYMGLIPEDKALPAVRFHVQDTPQDTRVIGETRILVTIDWLIVVVNLGLLVSPLITPVNNLDAALHGASGTQDSLKIDCTRLQPFEMLEPDDSGVQYRHAGGIYRTIVAKA